IRRRGPSGKNGKRRGVHSIHANVIHERPLSRQIAAGGHAREIAKFVGQMRLIVIAARQRHIRPIHASARGDLPHYLSKTNQPAIERSEERRVGKESKCEWTQHAESKTTRKQNRMYL